MEVGVVSRAALQGALAVAVGVLMALALSLRLITFSVLAVCAPVVRVVLSLASVSLFATGAFYAVFAPYVHVRQGIMLAIATGFAVVLAVYEMALRALAP